MREVMVSKRNIENKNSVKAGLRKRSLKVVWKKLKMENLNASVKPAEKLWIVES